MCMLSGLSWKDKKVLALGKVSASRGPLSSYSSSFCTFFLAILKHTEFPGQESDLSYSCDLSHSRSNAVSFNPLCQARDWTCTLALQRLILLCHSRNSPSVPFEFHTICTHIQNWNNLKWMLFTVKNKSFLIWISICDYVVGILHLTVYVNISPCLLKNSPQYPNGTSFVYKYVYISLLSIWDIWRVLKELILGYLVLWLL